MITTLSIVNEMLGTVGELPLSDLDAFHPMVSAGLLKLNTANAIVQGDKWWFNTDMITLTPQVDTGYILLPEDTLAVDSVSHRPHVAMRGSKLYNLDDSTDVFTDPMDCVLHRLIAFDDLPPNARSYVGAVALQMFQITYDGDATKAKDIEQRVNLTRIMCSAEHTRRKQVNMFNRPGVAYHLQRIVGYRRLVR